MQKLTYIFVGLTVIALAFLSYTVYSLNGKLTEKNAVQDRQIAEIAGVLTAGGMVVPDKDGKPTINTLLLEAWKESQKQPIQEWRQNNPTP